MEKERKQWRLSELDWKSEVIVFLLLMASAFFINRGIKIKGLFMDDLYMWSCYGEQTFREFVFPVGWDPVPVRVLSGGLPADGADRDQIKLVRSL